MKGFLTPLESPCHLTNTLNTPNDQSLNHYFAARHIPSEDHHARIHIDNTNAHFAAPNTRNSNAGDTSLALLPNEILSFIFELGYQDLDSEYRPDTAFRKSTLQVSRKFRDLVLRNPALWSIVWLSRSNIDEEIKDLPTHLDRAMEYPLDIRLNCFWDTSTSDNLMSMLLPRSKRWRRLAITITDNHVLQSLQNTPVPLLQHLDISFYSHQRRIPLPPHIFEDYAPSLSYLCLRNIDLDNLNFSLRTLNTLEIRGYGNWPEYEQLNGMLGGSECLERLILHVKPSQVLQQVLSERMHPHSSHDILLPRLRMFEVYTSEWLTPNVSALVKLFTCPEIETLFIRESAMSPTENPQTIVNYAMHPISVYDTHFALASPSAPQPSAEKFSNHLFVQKSNVFLALSAMGNTTLTTLELHKVSWPNNAQLKTSFSSLKALQNLFILDLDPTEAILQLLRGCGLENDFHSDYAQSIESTISLPSLERLMISIHPTSHLPLAVAAHTTAFVRMFAVPMLKTLQLKNLTREQWKKLGDAFASHVAEYLELSTLGLSSMTDVLPTDPSDPCFSNIVNAFPRLRDLTLDGVHSNAFLHQLAAHPTPAPSIAIDGDEYLPLPRRSINLPDLRRIYICNDPNASKPLLHRLINLRQERGVPLKELCLDSHFKLNADSWAWLNEHVEVVEISAQL